MKACSAFPSIFRLLPSLSLYARALFLGVLWIIGWLSFSGESEFQRTAVELSKQSSMALIHGARAEAIFPLQYRIRETITLLIMTSQGIPPEIALEQGDKLLSTDNSAPVLLQKAVLLLSNKLDATETIEAFNRITPEGKEKDNANEFFNSLRGTP